MFRPMIRIIKKDSDLRRVESEYRLTKTLLGESRWQVFKGKDTKRDLDVAIKVVKGQTLRHELKAHKKVQPIVHPHLIRVLDLSVKDNELWVILEYADQAEHNKLSELNWPEDPTEKQLKLTHLALQILDALAVLSAHGLIHDDVKPDNILVKPCPDGEYDGDFARLLDYGSVCSFETQTITKTRFYSQGYSAPDHFPPDNRRDSFSTARVLAEIILGYLPPQELRGGDRASLLEKAPILAPTLIKALCLSAERHELDVEEFANQCRVARRRLQLDLAQHRGAPKPLSSPSENALVSQQRWQNLLDLNQRNLTAARQTGELLRKKIKASQKRHRGTQIFAFFMIVFLTTGLMTVSIYHSQRVRQLDREVLQKEKEAEKLQLKNEQLQRDYQELKDRNFDLNQVLKAQQKSQDSKNKPARKMKTPF